MSSRTIMEMFISSYYNMKQALPGKLAKLITNYISLVLDEQTYAKPGADPGGGGGGAHPARAPP